MASSVAQAVNAKDVLITNPPKVRPTPPLRLYIYYTGYCVAGEFGGN